MWRDKKKKSQPVNWGLVLGSEGKVYPTDIDGCLERRGKFLILEWKHHSVREMPQGQDILYQRLARLDDFTVLYLFGDYETWRVFRIQKLGQHEQPVNSNNEALLGYMRLWWANASDTKKPRQPRRKFWA